MPRISIIMPLFNSVKYLRESIDSILNQTFTDWEFIIINEYSSNDGSVEIIRDFAETDDRFIFIQNEKRLGISESMNRGIEAAKGEYIARMDADDISLPERFQKQIAYMDQNPDIAMCGVMAEIFGSRSFAWDLETDSEQLLANILFYSPCIHPAVMIRKSFLDKYGIRYNRRYTASEDYDLFSKICMHGRIANLKEILFRYRMMEQNATFKNNETGVQIYREVMERQFQILGLAFSEDELKLLSPHDSIKGLSGRDVYDAAAKAELLLQRIFIANEKKQRYKKQYLWMTLRRRFLEICESAQWFCSGFDNREIEKIKSHSIFRHETFYESRGEYKKTGPLVSVIMPVFHSADYIMGAVWSVLEQTYENYELLIINEAGSEDDALFIASMFKDKRIRVIQNKTRLGLAESLNRGMREAQGRYIARMDADDLCAPRRFEMQAAFLEKNPEYGLCGTWQHHFGIGVDWIHKCSTSFKDIQAELLFNCDLCHSTLMLRKRYFLENHLFYDASYAAEDYELWTRAVKVFKMANLPHVLGEYRVGDRNITAKKMERLSKESGRLAAKNIAYYFGIKLPQHLVPLQSGWRNEFQKLSPEARKKALKDQELLFRKMWKINESRQKLDGHSLLKTINKKWRCITNTWEEDGKIYEMDELFRRFRYNHTARLRNRIKNENYSVRQVIKNILRRPYYSFKCRTVDVLQRNIWDIDGHLGDYFQKLLLEIHRAEEESSRRVDFLRREIGIRMETIEKNVKEKMDVRIWKAEQEIKEMTDARIWKAEQEIKETADARIWKAEQEIKETADARIWKAEQNIIEFQKVWGRLLAEFQAAGRKLILINTPSHQNLGDHAIAYAEKCWIKDRLPYHMIEISGEVYRKYHAVIKELIQEEDIIALSGGGYIGTLWSYEEELVEQVVLDYPENQICIFPQSIYFSEDEAGRKALNKARAVFENHNHFIMFVRESISLDTARKNFPKCTAVLAGDMVLYFCIEEKNLTLAKPDKNGIALCLKDDKESIICEEDKRYLQKSVEKTDKELILTDTILENAIDASMRFHEIRKKILEFQSYEMVITDRFHGIIFSILAGTKCIALEGISHKNRGLCQMFSQTNCVVFAQRKEEVKDIIADGTFLKSAIDLKQIREVLKQQFSDMEKFF